MTGIYSALDYGIRSGESFNNTEAFRALFKLIEDNGGGTLYVPPGKYVTGSILIPSNTTLYLEGGAVILGSPEPEDYPLLDDSVIPGWGPAVRRGLVSALNAVNVTITGRGTVDGQGFNWWHRNKDDTRPRAVQPIGCDNVRISGITVVNSAMWTVHPVCCNNVTIDGISIKNPSDSPNTDGINPEGCSNVHIANCHIDVGDDCVTIKSGTQYDNYRRRPCENITVTNCTMNNGHGGVVIGSEMSGGVRHVVISNCVFNGTDRGIRIKTRRKRGGCVEDVRVTGISMVDVYCPLVLNGYYMCGAPADDMSLFSKEALPVNEGTPVFKDIAISGVTASGVSACALFVYGIPESPVVGLSVSDFHVKVKRGEVTPRQAAMMHGLEPMAKAGIRLTNVVDCNLRNLTIDTDGADSPLYMTAVKEISVDGLRAPNAPSDAAVKLVKCESVRLRGVPFPVSAEDSEKIDAENGSEG